MSRILFLYKPTVNGNRFFFILFLVPKDSVVDRVRCIWDLDLYIMQILMANLEAAHLVKISRERFNPFRLKYNLLHILGTTIHYNILLRYLVRVLIKCLYVHLA